jgi:hypothetical protein
VNAHDAVVMNGADETRLLSVVCAEMLMIGNACREMKALSKLGTREAAVEINPFAAVISPGLTAKLLAKTRGDKCLFEWLEMFASHICGSALMRPTQRSAATLSRVKTAPL